MSIYKSKTGIIDSCETLIFMDGIAAIANNDGIDELYLFRDALEEIGSTEKRAIIEEVIRLYEGANGRRPTQEEAEEVYEESADELNGFDDQFYGCGEKLEELCIAYARSHPDEIALLEEDAADSQGVAKVLAAVRS